MSITGFHFVYRPIFIVNLWLLASLLPFAGMALDQQGSFFAEMAVRKSILCFGFSVIAPVITHVSGGVLTKVHKGTFFFDDELKISIFFLPTALLGGINLLTVPFVDPFVGLVTATVLSALAFVFAIFGFSAGLHGWPPFKKKENTSLNQDVPMTNTQQG
jgi:hypothetical protein